MKKNKLNRFETKKQSEITPQMHKANLERAVDMMMAVYERMPKDNIQPVKESFSELARQAKAGIVRQPTIIQSETTKIITPAITFPPNKNITGGDTGNDSSINNETFTPEEKAILDSLK